MPPGAPSSIDSSYLDLPLHVIQHYVGLLASKGHGIYLRLPVILFTIIMSDLMNSTAEVMTYYFKLALPNRLPWLKVMPKNVRHFLNQQADPD